MKMYLTVLMCGVIATAGGQAFGQAGGHSHEGHADHAHGDHDHSGETLAFRLPQWKEMQFEDGTKAAQHLQAVKKLGCEVKQGNHAGHFDVSYRCPEWKTLAVKSHELAEQWAGWLNTAGFDVSHSHMDSAFAEGAEAVEFRMTQWKQLHGNGSPAEAQMIQYLKKIGCEVVVENHGGHSDISFRAPTWRDIHVADHAAAEQWIAWLRQNGFETHHEH